METNLTGEADGLDCESEVLSLQLNDLAVSNVFQGIQTLREFLFNFAVSV